MRVGHYLAVTRRTEINTYDGWRVRVGKRSVEWQGKGREKATGGWERSKPHFILDSFLYHR